MEAWYREMLADTSTASTSFRSDLDRFAGLFGRLTGRILDVGGGNGMVRCYLKEPFDYVSLDPSLAWLDPEWTKLSEDWPCLSTQPSFVQGVGENLPFADESFDVALVLWSLNHARGPDVFMAEIRRVVRSGGSCILVLEDMQPSWADIISTARKVRNKRRVATYAKHKALISLGIRRMEVQPDHLYISERGLRRWSKGFEVKARWWAGSYLSFDLLKRG
jgi:ubiquinone/menaquinone biosynthesis C-methylase UbiE